MTIKEFLKTPHIYDIHGIKAELNYVNMFDDIDIDEKTVYDEGAKYSFKQRLKKAICELKSDIEKLKEKTSENVLKFYKDGTTDDNANYYGNFLCVYTNTEESDTIMIGVRMD